MTAKVTITFNCDFAEYNDAQTKEDCIGAVQAMVNGDADWPWIGEGVHGGNIEICISPD